MITIGEMRRIKKEYYRGEKSLEEAFFVIDSEYATRRRIWYLENEPNEYNDKAYKVVTKIRDELLADIGVRYCKEYMEENGYIYEPRKVELPYSKHAQTEIWRKNEVNS